MSPIVRKYLTYVAAGILVTIPAYVFGILVWTLMFPLALLGLIAPVLWVQFMPVILLFTAVILPPVRLFADKIGLTSKATAILAGFFGSVVFMAYFYSANATSFNDDPRLNPQSVGYYNALALVYYSYLNALVSSFASGFFTCKLHAKLMRGRL